MRNRGGEITNQPTEPLISPDLPSQRASQCGHTQMVQMIQSLKNSISSVSEISIFLHLATLADPPSPGSITWIFTAAAGLSTFPAASVEP